MNGKRLGAVVLAIVLVAGAFYFRNNVIEDGSAADPQARR